MTGDKCPTCTRPLQGDLCSVCGPVSEVGDSLDSMVEQASVPNLATLFKRAKDAGVIGPVSVYGEGAPAGAAAP